MKITKKANFSTPTLRGVGGGRWGSSGGRWGQNAAPETTTSLSQSSQDSQTSQLTDPSIYEFDEVEPIKDDQIYGPGGAEPVHFGPNGETIMAGNTYKYPDAVRATASSATKGTKKATKKTKKQLAVEALGA